MTSTAKDVVVFGPSGQVVRRHFAPRLHQLVKIGIVDVSRAPGSQYVERRSLRALWQVDAGLEYGTRYLVRKGSASLR